MVCAAERAASLSSRGRGVESHCSNMAGDAARICTLLAVKAHVAGAASIQGAAAIAIATGFCTDQCVRSSNNSAGHHLISRAAKLLTSLPVVSDVTLTHATKG